MISCIYFDNCFILDLELHEKHDWYRLGYADKFDASLSAVKDNVERVDARRTSLQEFIDRYEKPYKPVVVTHVEDDWKAQKKWTMDVRHKFRGFHISTEPCTILRVGHLG